MGLLLCENGLVGEEEPVLTAALWPSDCLLRTATVEEACEGETESCSPCLCIFGGSSESGITGNRVITRTL